MMPIRCWQSEAFPADTAFIGGVENKYDEFEINIRNHAAGCILYSAAFLWC
ncbi:MAG TPA: hypothetical protein VHO94_06510 [Oscillospiraceae bacterium]|nr:hypothetical protein [Oscillospiraceae bacterium]